MRFKEDALLIAVMDYIRYQYPTVLAAHIANERKASPQQGARMKRKGVKAGMPDIMIFKLKGDYNCGLAIELKIHPNKPTKHQTEILNKLSEQGWATHVCYSFDDAKMIIDDYLK